jgi:hypothetical protein
VRGADEGQDRQPAGLIMLTCPKRSISQPGQECFQAHALIRTSPSCSAKSAKSFTFSVASGRP